MTQQKAAGAAYGAPSLRATMMPGGGSRDRDKASKSLHAAAYEAPSAALAFQQGSSGAIRTSAVDTASPSPVTGEEGGIHAEACATGPAPYEAESTGQRADTVSGAPRHTVQRSAAVTGTVVDTTHGMKPRIPRSLPMPGRPKGSVAGARDSDARATHAARQRTAELLGRRRPPPAGRGPAQLTVAAGPRPGHLACGPARPLAGVPIGRSATPATRIGWGCPPQPSVAQPSRTGRAPLRGGSQRLPPPLARILPVAPCRGPGRYAWRFESDDGNGTQRGWR